jgi:hypothetical protein
MSVANDELVRYDANYSGLIKFGWFLVEVGKKHVNINIVQQYIFIYCQKLAIWTKTRVDRNQIQAYAK